MKNGNKEIEYKADASLFDQVETVFEKAGLENPGFVRSSRWLAQGTPEMDHQHQRSAINNVLRMQIGAFPENTLNVRSCLIEDGSHDDWLRLIKEEVTPCLMRNSIPTKSS